MAEHCDIITFVLDASGSMASAKQDAIDGFNEYIEGLRAAETPSLLKLITFNSQGINHGEQYIDVTRIARLNAETYLPMGGTPLLDAVGEAILSTDSALSSAKAKPGVIVVILTDGLENASIEYSRRDIHDLIVQRRELGWEFIFLAANQDAWRTGAGLGVGARYTSGFDIQDKKAAFRSSLDSSLRIKQQYYEKAQEERRRRSRQRTPGSTNSEN